MSIQTAWHSEARDKYKGPDGLPANHDRAMAEAIPLADGGTAWVAAVADGCGGDDRGTRVAQLALDRLRQAVASATAETLAHNDSAAEWARPWSKALTQEIVNGSLRGGNSTLTAGILVRDPDHSSEYRLLMLAVGDSPAFLFAGSSMERLGVVPDPPTDNPNTAENGKSLVRAVGLAVHPNYSLFDLEVTSISESALPAVLFISSDGAVSFRDTLLLYPRDFKQVIAAESKDFATLPHRLLERSLDNANRGGFTKLDNSSVALLGIDLERAPFLALPPPVPPPSPPPKPVHQLPPAPPATTTTAPAAQRRRTALLRLWRSKILPAAMVAGIAGVVTASVLLVRSYRNQPDRILDPHSRPFGGNGGNGGEGNKPNSLVSLPSDLVPLWCEGASNRVDLALDGGKDTSIDLVAQVGPPKEDEDGGAGFWTFGSRQPCEHCATNTVELHTIGDRRRFQGELRKSFRSKIQISWKFKDSADRSNADVTLEYGDGEPIPVKGKKSYEIPVHTNVILRATKKGFEPFERTLGPFCSLGQPPEPIDISFSPMAAPDSGKFGDSEDSENGEKPTEYAFYILPMPGGLAPLCYTVGTNRFDLTWNPDGEDHEYPLVPPEKGMAWTFRPENPCQLCQNRSVSLTPVVPDHTNLVENAVFNKLKKTFPADVEIFWEFDEPADRTNAVITLELEGRDPVVVSNGVIFARVPVHTSVTLIAEKEGAPPFRKTLGDFCFEGQTGERPVVSFLRPVVFEADFTTMPSVKIVGDTGDGVIDVPEGSGVCELPRPRHDEKGKNGEKTLCEWTVVVPDDNCPQCHTNILRGTFAPYSRNAETNRVPLSPAVQRLSKKASVQLKYAKKDEPAQRVWINEKEPESLEVKVPAHSSVLIRAERAGFLPFETNVVADCYGKRTDVEIAFQPEPVAPAVSEPQLPSEKVDAPQATASQPETVAPKVSEPASQPPSERGDAPQGAGGSTVELTPKQQPKPVAERANLWRGGSSGEDVKYLQEQLRKQGYSLNVDGEFGPQTENAVKDFQKKHGLPVDGKVDRKTWDALEERTSSDTLIPQSSLPPALPAASKGVDKLESSVQSIAIDGSWLIPSGTTNQLAAVFVDGKPLEVPRFIPPMGWSGSNWNEVWFDWASWATKSIRHELNLPQNAGELTFYYADFQPQIVSVKDSTTKANIDWNSVSWNWGSSKRIFKTAKEDDRQTQWKQLCQVPDWDQYWNYVYGSIYGWGIVKSEEQKAMLQRKIRNQWKNDFRNRYEKYLCKGAIQMSLGDEKAREFSSEDFSRPVPDGDMTVDPETKYYPKVPWNKP